MKLFLLGMEHECATRVPDKPLRPFAGTTLFDIYLKKFKALQDCDLFSGQGIALWKGDKRLWEKAEETGVPIIERSEASAKGHGDYKVIFEFLEDVDAEWILRVNCCAPFLTASSIRELARGSSVNVANMHSYRNYLFEGKTTVYPSPGWLWTATGTPANDHATATQACRATYMSTQGAHVFRRKRLLDTGRCFDHEKMEIGSGLHILVGRCEWIDVDTGADFDLARRIAESFTEEEWKALYSSRTD